MQLVYFVYFRSTFFGHGACPSSGVVCKNCRGSHQCVSMRVVCVRWVRVGCPWGWCVYWSTMNIKKIKLNDVKWKFYTLISLYDIKNLDTNSQFFIYYSEFRHCFPWLILNLSSFFKAHFQWTNNTYEKSCQTKLKLFKLYRIKIQRFHCSSLNYSYPWTVFLYILNSTCNVITFNKGVWSISLFNLQATFNGIFSNK